MEEQQDRNVRYKVTVERIHEAVGPVREYRETAKEKFENVTVDRLQTYRNQILEQMVPEDRFDLVRLVKAINGLE